MSNIATARLAPAGRLSLAAFALALGAVIAWVLAATVDDGLYLAQGVLGLAALALGRKARNDARRAGSNGALALAAMIIGGLLATLVIAFTVVWGISELV